jgi:sulfhydrogenase subunit beta (sulfur reductase)
MSDSNVNPKSPLVIDRQSLQKLLDVLAKGGYSLIGPRVRDQAMVYDEISSDADLPIGWTDKQDCGTYRFSKNGHKKLFDFTVGSQY